MYTIIKAKDNDILETVSALYTYTHLTRLSFRWSQTTCKRI